MDFYYKDTVKEFEEATKRKCNLPLLRPTIIDDNSGKWQTYGILDSGTETVVLPFFLAEMLKTKLTPEVEPMLTNGGNVSCFKGTLSKLVLGGIEFNNVEFITAHSCLITLLGIKPLFEKLKVTIDTREQKITLEPY